MVNTRRIFYEYELLHRYLTKFEIISFFACIVTRKSGSMKKKTIVKKSCNYIPLNRTDLTLPKLLQSNPLRRNLTLPNISRRSLSSPQLQICLQETFWFWFFVCIKPMVQRIRLESYLGLILEFAEISERLVIPL